MVVLEAAKDAEKEDKGRAETACVRSEIYRLLSLALLYPREDFFAFLSKGAFTEELKKYFSYLLVNNSEEEIREDVLKNLEVLEGIIKSEFQNRDLSYFQERYIEVFGHTVNKDYPPLGCHYGSEHIFQKSQDLGNIAGFYSAFGLERSEKEKESLDHISVELEFMYVLTFKEGYALENHGSEKADICVDAQKKFLKNEVGMWAPLFAKLLEKKAKDEFYKKIAALLKIFMEMEAAFLKVKPRRLKAPAVSDSLDESERCAGTGMECGLEPIEESTKLADFI